MKRTASAALPDGAAEATGPGTPCAGAPCAGCAGAGALAVGCCAGAADCTEGAGRWADSAPPPASRGPDEASERMSGGGGSLLGAAWETCERESIGLISTGVAWACEPAGGRADGDGVAAAGRRCATAAALPAACAGGCWRLAGACATAEPGAGAERFSTGAGRGAEHPASTPRASDALSHIRPNEWPRERSVLCKGAEDFIEPFPRGDVAVGISRLDDKP